jgi:hypothetical protein
VTRVFFFALNENKVEIILLFERTKN